MKATRNNMFAWMATDMVKVASDLSYEELHAWLQPIFYKAMAADMALEDDEAVAALYQERLGVAPLGWEQGD